MTPENTRPFSRRPSASNWSREKTVDASSSEGRALIRQYSIAALPTVIISPEAEAYADLITAWKGVGSVEKDGWLVFRKMDALGQETYNDLKTGTVIRPASASRLVNRRCRCNRGRHGRSSSLIIAPRFPLAACRIMAHH